MQAVSLELGSSQNRPLHYKGLRVNANGFIFATIFLDGFYPPKMFFFYLSHFGGCEDDLYISTQQIDGWADTLKTFNKTPY